MVRFAAVKLAELHCSTGEKTNYTSQEDKTNSNVLFSTPCESCMSFLSEYAGASLRVFLRESTVFLVLFRANML